MILGHTILDSRPFDASGVPRVFRREWKSDAEGNAS